MNKQFLRFNFFLLMYLTLPLTATGQVVSIPDPNLRAAIETTLGKAAGAPITTDEVATLTRLEAQNANISDLTGLEHATDLTFLDLGAERVETEGRYINNNSVSDLSPLAGLINLKWLRISGNSISDISPVAGLTNLIDLELWNNSNISDISSLSGLTNLTFLFLDNNSISDISPLAGLINLTRLGIAGNGISDISAVAGLMNLTWLNLDFNDISDISPLEANTGLGREDAVRVKGNPLSYLSIHTHIPTLQSRGVTVEFDNRTPTTLLIISGVITELDNLLIVEVRDSNGFALEGVPVTFTVISGGGTLSATRTTTDADGRAESWLTLGSDGGPNTVRANVEGISEPVTFSNIAVNIPDPNLRAAVEIALGKVKGKPIAPSEMATLTHLEARNANISDLTGLEFATNLKSLWLDGEDVQGTWRNSNSVSDLSPLAGLTHLEELDLWKNSVSDLSVLAGLTNLKHLGLTGNNISDMSVLADLTNLESLSLGGNPISDLSPLAGLTQLTRLDLSQTSISNISALAGLTNLKTLRLEHSGISDLSPLVANVGLGNRDEVYLRGNPLSYTSIKTHIPTLQSRRVTVEFDNRTPTTLQKTLSVITELDSLLIVEVRDSNGLAFEGVPVIFSVTSGGGTLSATRITTDENGRAENRFTLGPDGGTSTVRASVEGISEPAIFTPSVNTNGMVRLVYFLPNDRPARPDRAAALRQLIKDAQQFYADEMDRHGFGRKAFTIETDADGEPLIHRVNGKFTEEYYYDHSTDFKVWEELHEHFDNFQHVYFVAIDISNEALYGGNSCGAGAVSFRSSNRGLWLRNRESPKGQSIGGIATIPASGDCFRLRTTAHELGHAFGLVHDFRKGRSSDYLMAYGTATRLSECAAEWLSVNRFFNTKPIFRNEPGEIQILELQPHSQDTISLRFKATDPDGLHHAQLVLPEGSLGPVLFNCQQLNGKTSTVEFAVSTVELVHRITLEVIDAGIITLQIIDLGGNITWARFPIQLDGVLSDQKLTALEKISGDNQYGLTFTPLPSPLVVKVTDQNGFAFSGEVVITFTVTVGDGMLSVTHTKTNKNGRAESMLTLGPNLGTNTVEVSAAGIEQTVTFNAVARTAVDIPDSNLRAAIETTLGVALSNPIALSEMAALTRLEASNANISDLTGLEFATNLTELELGPERIANEWRNSNAVKDLSPLAGLTRLTRLHLPNNSISDISAVADLTSLTWLNLWGNSISAIFPVAGLTKLTDLYLGDNNISDISPLAANTGLGSGDTVNVKGNPLSYLSIHTHIPALQNKGVTVEFDNQAHPALLKISGDNQKGAAFAPLSQPFVIEAQDANGSVLTGISVTFAVTGGGGTLSATITRTDENGRAQSTLALGPNLGTNTVEVSAAGIESPVTFYAISDTESPPIEADINNDGSVNILDLILIASDLGNVGTNLAADVNRDRVVSILDLILAAGMFDGAAAAPSAQPQVPETLTAVEVQGWLIDARALEVRDSIVKRGFVVLEQLLVSLTPKETELLANYPNPFNPETWIPYRLAEDAFVTLTIYDLSGRVVRTLDVGHRIASAYENQSKAIYWDGRNGLGERVASGVFFYNLSAGKYSATRKMVILK